jgi:probable phosphoglycerate mutase
VNRPATLLLIRHATNPNVGRGLTGWLPGVSLDEEGRKQADRLADRLASTPLDAIYSSPLERALETAAPLARRRNLDIVQNPDLGELRFGEWQGRTYAELEHDSIWRRFNEYRSSTAAPGGEMMIEAQVRMVRGLSRIALAHPGGAAAVFSHADAIKSALMHILGMPLDLHLRLDIPPASISVVETGPDLARVLGINVGHVGKMYCKYW